MVDAFHIGQFGIDDIGVFQTGAVDHSAVVEKTMELKKK